MLKPLPIPPPVKLEEGRDVPVGCTPSPTPVLAIVRSWGQGARGGSSVLVTGAASCSTAFASSSYLHTSTLSIPKHSSKVQTNIVSTGLSHPSRRRSQQLISSNSIGIARLLPGQSTVDKHSNSLSHRDLRTRSLTVHSDVGR